ncbi:glycosyltransferase [Cohnella sp. 56]|uniref:glycosyltransferase n=1 Tax=Cohnella sp. 56 TaxID=3113722 RepID=UPI0030E87413
MSRTKLSLCMIVRNEADVIERCLASVAGVVDEMVVVDTGSQDSTPDIARSAGAEVYRYPWTGSFADARNYSLGRANGEWILWMDADEALQAGDGELLRDAIETTKAELLLVETIHYVGGGPPDPNRCYTLAHHRLFRNREHICFSRTVHEQLMIGGGIRLEPGTIPGILPIRIHHYGYLEEAVERRQKSLRNIEMLVAEKNAGGCAWTDYHLAAELHRAGNESEAFALVNEAIVGFLASGQLPPSIVYRLKYEIMIAHGSFAGAWPGIEKAIALYPDYVDLHFYKGIILLLLERYEQALAAFETCRRMGERCSLHLSRRGCGSFYADYYIGRCYEKMSAAECAREAYARALSAFPDLDEAAEGLSRIEGERGEGTYAAG